MAPQNKPACPKCGSHEVRTRRTDGISWCRICGNEWPSEQTKKEA